MSKTIKITKVFSRTPGPRYAHEGKFSGEEFREKILVPEIETALKTGDQIELDLDGTAGYGTSFLEESFGGLVRNHKLTATNILSTLKLVSEEEPYLIKDIRGYLADAENETK